MTKLIREFPFKNPVLVDENVWYFDDRIYRAIKGELYPRAGKHRLHMMVWRKANGVIPIGCHIHHIDNNKFNNNINNLQSMKAHEHMSKTWHETREIRNAKMAIHKIGRTIGALARLKSNEWHRSKAGREFTRAMMLKQKNWKKGPTHTVACFACGKMFHGRVTKKYCCERCYLTHKWRRKYYRKKEKAKKLDIVLEPVKVQEATLTTTI